MRRLLSVLAMCALLVAACGGGDGDAPNASSTTARGSSSSTTTDSPAVSVACTAVSIPTGATNVTKAVGDVDGDGKDDTIRSYLVGDTSWHLQATLATGGGADLGLTVLGPGAVTVLGGADVDGDGADEVWAQTGSGASAAIIGLARFAECALTRVTFAGGDPAELPVGGSVGTAAGVECAAHVDPSADLTTYTASNTGGDTYQVTATEFALEGTTLVQKGTTSSTATIGDDTFARATSFVCHGLSL